MAAAQRHEECGVTSPQTFVLSPTQAKEGEEETEWSSELLGDA
jgi:hypothetical protein